MRKEDVALVSAEENTGVEEYILDPRREHQKRCVSKKDIPEMIDLRDMDGASSLVVKLFPSLTKIEVETALSIMITGFYDGTGTDWVPLGNALRVLLRSLRAEVVTAGNMFLVLCHGVNLAAESYTATVRKSLIECNLQSGRGVAKALDEN